MSEPTTLDIVRAKIRRLIADKTRAEVERGAAIQHLFNILDGADRERAIEDARAWLERKYGEDYQQHSRVSVIVTKALSRLREGDSEFPDEL